MRRRTSAPSLRVEKVLRLLPEVDAMAPLRTLLVSTSRAEGADEPHLTVGKRIVQSADLEELVPRALQRVSEHLSELFEAAITALEAEASGDTASAVRAFLRAGDRELAVGRESAARIWYEHALRIAEEARDRRPEIEALQQLGALEAALGARDRAARHYQRAFALAEAEGDDMRAASACLAMGTVALNRFNLQGAVSWFQRGLQHGDGNHALSGRLHLGLAEVARTRDDLDEAEQRVRLAETMLTDQADTGGMVAVLSARGRLESARGRYSESLARHREALAFARLDGRDARLELPVHLDICRLFMETDRLPDAEDEARRAEQMAVVHNETNELARIYVLMGGIRRLQRDESGFVFFEKAIELSQGGEPTPHLEADAYFDYAVFRESFGEHDEARAYLERSREILETLGDRPALARIDEMLRRLPASGVA
ncbi:MAG TPA: hypothetical protein VFM71_11270 [Gemmatimonadaceae bacterium]|nr:hypothetical protein [Gemmatimonadaceae bacterium]